MFSDTFPIHFHVNEPLAKDHPYIKDQICLIFRVALRPDLPGLWGAHNTRFTWCLGWPKDQICLVFRVALRLDLLGL